MTYNIDRNNTDQFYRYKMPRLVAKVEGSGNGIKTVIANITDIAKSLERPPTYPLKYFGYELGAQTMIDAKNERYIVNGSHEAVRLQEMLDGFIKKFVLCPNCNNPETRLIVQTKKNIIRQKCAACGHDCMADMKHKLSSYVLKNPPLEVGEYGETAKSAKKGGKKGKGKDEASAKNGTNGNGAADAKAPTSPTNESDDPFSVSADPPPPTNGDDGDDDWDDDGDWETGDLTEEARKQRQQELTSGIKNLTLDDDLEKTEDERLDLFYEFVKKQREANLLDDKKIMAEAERLEVKEKAPLILARVLFDADMVKQIARYKNVFARFTVGDRKAQKYLLGGFEHLVGEAFAPLLLPKSMKILKEFYDQDILEEEAILEWYDKPRKTFVKLSIAEDIRKKVEPFAKWLREAEEESSEDEEDESEEEVVEQKSIKKGAGDAGKAGKMVNGNAAKVVGKAQTNGGTNGKAGAATPPTEDDAEEVDIDAI
ncbi:hypothetical protein RvY_08726 [Ramazzottius varieornatus]|uniref:Eukaryotic translation initiation factor 5 n=1 Tax=Ramazzottius varieornatus TaxID=947166 RepID=A0A1D1VCF5_RAMVA|nr:hypothetical protein RvY_08726 [Ramazzottius varieornatus]